MLPAIKSAGDPVRLKRETSSPSLALSALWKKIQMKTIKTRGITLFAVSALVAASALLTGCIPQPTPTPTPDPAKGTYRLTINGFRVRSATWDDALQLDGKGDEVYVNLQAELLDKQKNTLDPRTPPDGNSTNSMGDTNGYPNRTKAGTMSPQGGIKDGDTCPSSTPWALNGSPVPDNLPLNAGTFALTQGQDKLVVTPTIWEWDLGGSDDAVRNWTGWLEKTSQGVTGLFGSKAAGVQKAIDVGLGAVTSSLDLFGHAATRPIGEQKSADGKSYVFNPWVISLDYETAEQMAKQDDGKGPGVKTLVYKDDPNLRGEYELYFQLTKLS